MIIGISGKISSGKDTVGIIIQYLTCIHSKHYTFKEWKERVEEFQSKHTSRFQIKKFADTLKDIICLLLGCTREQLEDADYKNTVLPEDWWFYRLSKTQIVPYGYYATGIDKEIADSRFLVKTTPRLLLQLMGTECGRQILHPNIWINSLFIKYLSTMTYDVKTEASTKIADGKYIVPRLPQIPIEHWDKLVDTRRFTWHENIKNNVYPFWIITDMRFPNEMSAVKERKGITIRINRPMGGSKFEGTQEEWEALVKRNSQPQHESETALDHAFAEFDYTIVNDGTLEELIEKVKEILIKEKIIT